MTIAGNYRDWKGWNEGTFASVSPADAVYFAAETAALVGGERSPVVLEIGFGNANFAQWAIAQGWRYQGNEIDSGLVAMGLEKGLDVHSADVPWPDAAFDLVVAFDVLEHVALQELPGLLARIRMTLKPGGLFLARFPSGDSPFARHIQHGDISHLSQIGTGMVEQLSLAVDLEIVQVRRPAFPVFGLGLGRALRRIMVTALRKVIGAILRVAFFDNQPRVISPNMVIVLRKPVTHVVA
ncbi:hypothetical protein AYO42_00645 [Rhizomicrobium sp. SCGC AG-212-E05]|nr:hypothetical protein AYO42_00645 [Rhizomicrobium sp. SCGC AG-212-E05]